MAKNKNENIDDENLEDVKDDPQNDDSLKEDETSEVQEASANGGEDDSKYLRLLAEFQNFKKRTEKEKSDTYAYANEGLIKELLGIVDNFERALENECADPKYAEGMANIFKLLWGILQKSGLEEIKSLGEEFDPNVHAAVATEDSEEYESGKVSLVLQKGYKLNGKVIRAAMVKVAN